MTKAEIVQAIYARVGGFSKKESADIVDLVFEMMKETLAKGERIKVTNGAFINFEGDVDEVIPDKGMVRIITTIFGRPTPLELEYWQIEKV